MELVRKMSTPSSIGPISLPVNHQGVVFFTTNDAESFTMTISPDKELSTIDNIEQQYFSLTVDCNTASLQIKLKGSQEATQLYVGEDSTVGITHGVLVTYWLSFLTNYDQETKKSVPELRYGKGFAMDKTTLMKTTCCIENSKSLFTYKTEKYVKVIQNTNPLESNAFTHHLELNKVPVTVDPSPIVTDSSKASLMDIDEDKTLSSLLPTKAGMLFDTVKDLELDPTLAKAIGYSLKAEGMTLYKKVREKSEHAAFAKNEAYIRVTLGQDTKVGVGIPFVLEIWPAGIRSPIHNHGDAVAVIKVLHGEIHIDNYNKITVPETYPNVSDRLHQFDCKKGDITWMDKNYYQVHQLVNKTDDYCATIQCYLCEERDHVYYPAFDYVENGCSNVEAFYPDSDFDYKVLRAKVLREYFDNVQPDSSTPCEAKARKRNP